MDNRTTPAPKKKRLNDFERLLNDIPHADMKTEKRRSNKRARVPIAATEGLGPTGNGDGGPVSVTITNINTTPDAGSYDTLYNSDYAEEDVYSVKDGGEDDDSVLTCELFLQCDNTAQKDDEPEDDLSSGSNQDNRVNRLIDFPKMKAMIEIRCRCSKCNSAFVLTEITVGIATTVILSCNHCQDNDRRTEAGMSLINGEAVGLVKQDTRGTTFRRPDVKQFVDYPIHYFLVLLMQQLGTGLEGMRAILSHLSIKSTVGDWHKWRRIMDTVGIAQQTVADRCMRDNIKAEIESSTEAGHPTCTDSCGIIRQGIAASVDMGWQKRSSGRRYDSPSGVGLMIGGLTKKILQRQVLCTHCRVCDNHQSRSRNAGTTLSNIREHRCPKNYKGTAKGMEPEAAVSCVKGFFHATTNTENCIPAFVDVVISDDDSSTWANLQQSLTERLDMLNESNAMAGLPFITKRECPFWPKTSRNLPKEDHGKLSINELPPRLNLADPNHRTKVLGKHIYPLTTQRQDSGKNISKATAERFKLNFGKALQEHRLGCPLQLKKALLATLEHEFGNHEDCGESWCKHKQAKDQESRNALVHRWRNKTDNKVLYEALQEIYDDFLTTHRIKQMQHGYDTQKNESMNTKIARTCPKTVTLSKSMVLSDRVAWVVIEDSIGGATGVVEVYKELQLGQIPTHLFQYYMKNDRRREREHTRKLQPNVKYRRNRDKHEKIRTDRLLAEQSRLKGQDYKSGIAFNRTAVSKQCNERASDTAVCKACGIQGHSRTTSKKCLMNKINVAKNIKDITREEKPKSHLTGPQITETTPSPIVTEACKLFKEDRLGEQRTDDNKSRLAPCAKGA